MICVKFFQLAVLGEVGGVDDIVVIQIHGFQRVNAAELDDGDQFVVRKVDFCEVDAVFQPVDRLQRVGGGDQLCQAGDIADGGNIC